MDVKKILKAILPRCPSLYRFVLHALGKQNSEKMAYLRLLKNGNTVFDVGANRGDFTVLFSNIVGPTGSVHAFEPVPSTFAGLDNRIKAECRFQNVAISNNAVGDTPGVVQIQVPAGDSGQASLKNHTIASWSRPEREVFDCSVVTLDSYVAEHKIDRVDLIKVDVEGAELWVFRGARQTMDRFRPIIHAECLPSWTGSFDYTPVDLVSFLRNQGYVYFYSGRLRPLHCPETEIGTSEENQNFVCSVQPLLHVN